jgi:hypothetical protein
LNLETRVAYVFGVPLLRARCVVTYQCFVLFFVCLLFTYMLPDNLIILPAENQSTHTAPSEDGHFVKVYYDLHKMVSSFCVHIMFAGALFRYMNLHCYIISIVIYTLCLWRSSNLLLVWGFTLVVRESLENNFLYLVLPSTVHLGSIRTTTQSEIIQLYRLLVQ